jgi:transposase InsO family protein
LARIGDRLAALEAIAQGLARHFAGVHARGGRGLALRMNRGTQYSSDHVPNPPKFWGIALRFAFVAQSQTHGVADRFNRTLKERASDGRVLRDIKEVYHAVAEFIERYNAAWRLEKLGFRTPREVPQAHALERAAICNSSVQTTGAGILQIRLKGVSQ